MAFPSVAEGVALIEAAKEGRRLSETEALRLSVYIQPMQFDQGFDRAMGADDWEACWKAIGKAAGLDPAEAPAPAAGP